jgi:hypothetical protein
MNNNEGYLVFIDGNSNNLRFRVIDNGGDSYSVNSSPLNYFEWYFFTAVYDADSEANTKVYIDATEDIIERESNFSSLDSLINDQHLKIGRTGTGAGTFNGSIDDIAIWDRTLTETEIQAIHANGISGQAIDCSDPISLPLDAIPPVVVSMGLEEGSVLVNFNVSDDGGSFLDRIEIWRVKDDPANPDNPGDWNDPAIGNPIGTIPINAGNNWNYYKTDDHGKYTDIPPSDGTWWYGLHVVDRAGNCTTEKNRNCTTQASNGQPEIGPKSISVSGGPPPPPPPPPSGVIYDIDFTQGALPPGCTRSGGTLNSNGWRVDTVNDRIVCDAGHKIAKGYIETFFTINHDPNTPTSNNKNNFFGAYEQASLDQNDYGDIVYARVGKDIYDFVRWKTTGDVMDSTSIATEKDVGVTSDWSDYNSKTYSIRLEWDGDASIITNEGNNSVNMAELGGFPINEIRYAFMGSDDFSDSSEIGMTFKTFKMVDNSTPFVVGSKHWDKGRLKVSSNGRYLQHEDGAPFFLFGDTAWTMFYRVPINKAEEYMADRSARGFNVIQTVVTGPGKVEGLDPSYNLVNGVTPFDNPNTPAVTETNPNYRNEQFFNYVDQIIDLAAQYNLYVNLLPAWGEYVCEGGAGGPEIFNTTNAASYGTWIANRYMDKPNIIWVIGGDRRPDQCGAGDMAIYRSMANAIKSVDQNHLMTWHPGYGFYEEFYNDSWLDFNMIQTYSHPDQNHPFVSQGYNYNVANPKPVFNGEPGYYQSPGTSIPGYYTKFDQRVYRSQMYWSVLSGAPGHIYGNTIVYIFDWETDNKLNNNNSIYDWWDFLDTAGTNWAQNSSDFFQSIEWWKLIPDQTIIASGVSSGNTIKTASRANDGSMILVYYSTRSAATIDFRDISTAQATAKWWNPQNKIESLITGALNTNTSHNLTPPAGWEDAILVIEEY